MTEKSAYEEHIEHTFNTYCMIVIRHAAIDAGRTLRQKWRQEISLEYLMEDNGKCGYAELHHRAADTELAALPF